MPDSPSTPDLDLSFLYQIADGSNDFVIESINMLLQQAPQALQQIDNSLKAKDWAMAGAEVHKLKPSVGFFGMLVSQQLLQEVESLCKAGGHEPAKISTKFNEAKETIKNSLEALAHIKATKEAGL